MIGSVLKNRYLIEEKIGEGTLFDVYKCVDKIKERTVAVKVLRPQYSSNRMFAERLLVEAQAMVGISHPGIVEVYDCGEESGLYYVIVEYVRGLDLKERIRRGAPFTLSTAVDVCLAICEVLDFSHKRGFIHGDLRPANVLVTPEGQLKIADYWVSNAVASQQSVRANTLISSIHYMAPEVAEGKTATAAADVYSLGIILFELLTATRPFDADSPIAIALKHAREPIPLMRPLNPGVPKVLEAVVARALQKDPEDRFRSAKSMLNELKSSRESLNLAKPLVWSESNDDQSVAPVVEASERGYAPEPSVPKKWLAVRNAMMIVVFILLVAMGYGAYQATKIPAEVKLPNLVGMKYTDAESRLAGQKVELVKRSEEYNENFPEGVILYMNPSAGMTIRASAKPVEVWVSKGSKYAQTPNVLKLTLEDGAQRIVDAGLNVGEKGQDYDSVIPAGNIISQTPKPGTRLERGKAVNIVYSLGPKPGEIPVTPTGEGNTETPSATESTPATDDNNSSGAKTRSFDVKLTCPAGAADQLVEIRVADDTGENVVFSEVKHPGDHIKKTVQGVGAKVAIRVYIDNKLVKEDHK